MGRQMQAKEQIKADAINDFVVSIVGALESGFINSNIMSVAQLHRAAQHYTKDHLGVELPHITEQWGVDIAELCGFVDGKLVDTGDDLELRDKLISTLEGRIRSAMITLTEMRHFNESHKMKRLAWNAIHALEPEVAKLNEKEAFELYLDK